MTVERLAKMLGALGALVAFAYWYPTDWPGSQFVQDFYANTATSLLSISITVLLVDRLYARREAEYQKQQLIREMGSSDKGFALRAAKEISAQGWLTDGSVHDCDLSQAALSGAILNNAVFTRVTLDGALLRDAKLKGARISGGSYRETQFNDAVMDDLIVEDGADFIGAYFAGASLRHAQLPGATLEETDFFRSDLSNANLAGAHLRRADLAEATLDGANFERANLADLINWEKIASMSGTRIAAVEGAPVGFRERALELGAIGGATDVTGKDPLHSRTSASRRSTRRSGAVSGGGAEGRDAPPPSAPERTPPLPDLSGQDDSDNDNGARP
ncbi:MAG TPA: pentapeptide repeat-containing protein [Candidatus Limnocylindrales bacterium]|nr:pentapeptide repeat-containing protein [Candidatus Limnocylindrales bacterium]